VFRSQQRTAAGSGCTITVEVAKTIDIAVAHVGCMAPFTSDPSCTVKQILDKANVTAAPDQLRFRSGTWHVGKERVADDCP
jgi:hypothetical protein